MNRHIKSDFRDAMEETQSENLKTSKQTITWGLRLLKKVSTEVKEKDIFPDNESREAEAYGNGSEQHRLPKRWGSGKAYLLAFFHVSYKYGVESFHHPIRNLPAPTLETPGPSILQLPIRSNPAKRRRPLATRAVKEWREYEEAVREKDLARALRFLKTMDSVSNSVQYPASSSSSYAPSNPSISYSPEFLGPEKDWEVLDTCLNADDMRLVGRAYAFLKDRGLLKNFGKRRNIVVDGTRDVTPTVLKELTGLEASKLAPKSGAFQGLPEFYWLHSLVLLMF
ncbi:hypothetical protein HPP92_005600 [Vanilla planifolia]|uniref:Uncharacterized protein n=1 Tax=Vanilla planifolia TaxID=51239 RepID=A0A835VFJ9_VANPL|nr:hypothetical protein HPP92_005600 [Vanilla planifolia]